jgi:hypothetical protein
MIDPERILKDKAAIEAIRQQYAFKDDRASEDTERLARDATAQRCRSFRDERSIGDTESTVTSRLCGVACYLQR